MTQKEEVRDLALVVDDVIVRLKSMSVKELKVLRAIIKELNSRRFY